MQRAPVYNTCVPGRRSDALCFDGCWVKKSRRRCLPRSGANKAELAVDGSPECALLLLLAGRGATVTRSAVAAPVAFAPKGGIPVRPARCCHRSPRSAVGRVALTDEIVRELFVPWSSQVVCPAVVVEHHFAFTADSRKAGAVCREPLAEPYRRVMKPHVTLLTSSRSRRLRRREPSSRCRRRACCCRRDRCPSARNRCSVCSTASATCSSSRPVEAFPAAKAVVCAAHLCVAA